MIRISDFIEEFTSVFHQHSDMQPWELTTSLPEILRSRITSLGGEYNINDGIAIHKTAIVEEGVILKAPIMIGADCFIGAHAYLRGGVYLGASVSIGPGCEIKSSIILSHSTTAHFNFIGDSIIGSNVNFEAGAVIANHYNERQDKTISIYYEGKTIPMNTKKFGALVGDHTKVGANAVLSPGTILLPKSIVKRLELIDQTTSP
jgi:NDP-sugar pyrophosphorylase family protein